MDRILNQWFLTIIGNLKLELIKVVETWKKSKFSLSGYIRVDIFYERMIIMFTKRTKRFIATTILASMIQLS